MNMHTSTRQLMRPTIVALVLFTLLTGVLYPLLVTAIAQIAFPNQANGSLITSSDGKIVGSRLIGQQFDQPQYFWGRLSATGPVAYNASASSGSNLGPINPALIGPDGSIQARINALAAADAKLGIKNEAPIPVDLVTASGSAAAAHYQAARVAAARGMALADVEALIERYTEARTFAVLGEPRVNVLLLNLALDGDAQ
jgi:K+-transporting ATPase ATPase C chain